MTLDPTASRRISRWASSLDLAHVGSTDLHLARRAFLDTVAVTFAGRDEPASRIVLDYARGIDGAQRGTVWVTGDQMQIEMAALVNGTMAHVLDYDDVSSPSRGHPSVVLWPAIAAVAEAEGRSYADAQLAFILGLEIVAKLGRLLGIPHVADGWHSTPTLGAFGAAVACGRLVGLDQERMVNAMGIAFAQAAGTRENFGTMSKSLQAGLGAAAAVRAVSLARLGFEASPSVLDGQAGFAAVYGRGESFEDMLKELGAPLETSRSGLDVKRYPLCYATHRAIDGVLALREEYGLTLDQVDTVHVEASAKASLALVHSHPESPLEAKFSMQFAIATALSDGTVNLESFDLDNILRPRIQAFLPKVASTQAEGPVLPRWADVRITLKDGRTLGKRVQDLKGSAENPLSDSELLEKFAECTKKEISTRIGEFGKRVLAREPNVRMNELLAGFQG